MEANLADSYSTKLEGGTIITDVTATLTLLTPN